MMNESLNDLLSECRACTQEGPHSAFEWAAGGVTLTRKRRLRESHLRETTSRGKVSAGKHLSMTHSEESPPDALSVQVSSTVGYSRVVGTPCGSSRIDIRLRRGAWHMMGLSSFQTKLICCEFGWTWVYLSFLRKWIKDCWCCFGHENMNIVSFCSHHERTF